MNLIHKQDFAIAQDINRRHLAAAAWVRSQVRLYKICGDKVALG
jgi:hypothetical protein